MYKANVYKVDARCRIKNTEYWNLSSGNVLADSPEDAQEKTSLILREAHPGCNVEFSGGPSLVASDVLVFTVDTAQDVVEPPTDSQPVPAESTESLETGEAK